LRSRVFNHFQGDHRSAKEMRIAQEIKRVEYRITSGELGALLLESRLIKETSPSITGSSDASGNSVPGKYRATPMPNRW
jgi:excinuclease UvrABC nuclease subunit